MFKKTSKKGRIKLSENSLKRTTNIIATHKLFTNFLDADIVNKLVHLFDASSNLLTDYVEKEREARGLDHSNITIKSHIYGYEDNKQILILDIKKDDIDYIHLSIHLLPVHFDGNTSGLIHFTKNILKTKYNSKGKYKKFRYTYIQLIKPDKKPNSLEFVIIDDNLIIKRNSTEYDDNLKKEMDVIITVLNRLFDEDNKEYYIGNKDKIQHIHNKTNIILGNINKFTYHTKRKNIGIKLYPSLVNNTPFTLSNKKQITRHRKKITNDSNNQLSLNMKWSNNIPFSISRKTQKTYKLKKN